MALSPVRLRASMSVGSAVTIAFTRSNSPALIASMKAALLDVVSGISRFYPGLALACALVTAVPAGAQTPAMLQETSPFLGATFDAATLRDLPLTNSPFVVLENITPEAIADRFSV